MKGFQSGVVCISHLLLSTSCSHHFLWQYEYSIFLPHSTEMAHAEVLFIRYILGFNQLDYCVTEMVDHTLLFETHFCLDLSQTTFRSSSYLAFQFPPWVSHLCPPFQPLVQFHPWSYSFLALRFPLQPLNAPCLNYHQIQKTKFIFLRSPLFFLSPKLNSCLFPNVFVYPCLIKCHHSLAQSQKFRIGKLYQIFSSFLAIISNNQNCLEKFCVPLKSVSCHPSCSPNSSPYYFLSRVLRCCHKVSLTCITFTWPIASSFPVCSQLLKLLQAKSSSSDSSVLP